MMKRNNLKKIASVFLVAMLLCSFSACMFATKVGAVSPRWVSILSIDLDMGFYGNEGTVTGTARKQSTASRIEGTLYLYKLVGDDWIYVDEWYNSKTRGTLSVGGDFACESGVTYKAVFVVTVYTNGIPESDTNECIKACP